MHQFDDLISLEGETQAIQCIPKLVDVQSPISGHVNATKDFDGIVFKDTGGVLLSTLDATALG